MIEKWKAAVRATGWLTHARGTCIGPLIQFRRRIEVAAYWYNFHVCPLEVLQLTIHWHPVLHTYKMRSSTCALFILRLRPSVGHLDLPAS